MLKKLAIVSSLAILLVPLLGLAQPTPTLPGTTVTTIGGVYTTVETIVKWVFTFFLIIAILFLIYSGFLYVTSGGDDEKLKKAKGFLIWGIIGIVIALLSQGILAIIENFLGVTYTTP